MCPPEPSGPDIDGVVADANAAGLPFVVIGGFSVIANGFVRATRDADLLVGDGEETDAALTRFFERVEARRLSDEKELTRTEITAAEHIRVATRHGIVDILRGGIAPLDFATVSERALETEIGAEPAKVASLRSIVAFKRLAGRPQDKRDLEELESLYGELPLDPIPGLDS
jgi:hypothetical protein